MSNPLPSAALLGCTGLVGSQILSSLLALPSFPHIHAIARRDALPQTSPNLSIIANPDTTAWPAALKSISPSPQILLSALGTTKAAAGTFAAQRAIDYDLNLAVARAAKENGTQVYVLISSAGFGPNTKIPYGRMKVDLEEAVKKLEFPYTVILQAGLLMGTRQESRPAEAVLRNITKGLRMVSQKYLTDWWAQDVDTIGRAAVRAGWECLEGKREKGVWVLGQAEIVKMGTSQD